MIRPSKIYIAGKIAGDPEYKKKFDYAAIQLSGEGEIVLNPAELPEGMNEADYMRICFSMMESADIIYMLRDWRDSKGATLEHAYAEYIEKTIVYESEEEIRENDFISREAALSLKYQYYSHSTNGYESVVHIDDLRGLPAADVVTRKSLEQIMWERDVCLEQLAAIGKGLGEKMDDVAPVVRCRECKHWETNWEPESQPEGYHFCVMRGQFPHGEFYCADAKRKDGTDNAET